MSIKKDYSSKCSIGNHIYNCKDCIYNGKCDIQAEYNRVVKLMDREMI